MAAVFPEDRYRAPPPVGAEDLEQLYADAAAVAQRAREEAFPPEAKKRLRRFNLREVVALLGVHPTDFYAAIDDPSNGLPQGEKVGAKRLFELADVLKIQEHFGLLPRANRCIFAINELPDLAGKVQVALFNVMQEGDVQIKGYPVRLPLDVMMVFSANPEDYTARGKIITPLKDRIGSEIRTHYPTSREAALAITAQEAWTARDADAARPGGTGRFDVPDYVREIVEEVAFLARADSKVDKRSGVSQRLPISVLENVVSNAERRALINDEDVVVPRVTDVYAALPAITGKFELEYEGELRGAHAVATDIIRAAVGNVFNARVDAGSLKTVIEWFEMGGTLQVSDTTPADELVDQAGAIQGLREAAERGRLMTHASTPALASAIDFLLEGLHAQRKISRNEEWRYAATDSGRRAARPEAPVLDPRPAAGGKKKYYN